MNKGEQLSAVLITFLILGYVLTGLRCYVRVKFTKLGTDDILAVFSLLVFTGFCTDLFWGIHHGGIGKHSYDVSIQTYSTGIKTFLIAEMLYVVSTCSIKIAFSITLLRIVDKRIHNYAVYAIYSVILIALIPAIFFFFWVMLTCRPISYLWEQLESSKKGKCRSQALQITDAYVQSALFFVCDSSLAVIPCFIIWKLRLGWKTKMSAIFLLGLGSITSIATLVRLSYIHLLKEPEILYITNTLNILSVTEAGVGIAATAAGTLRPLFLRAGILSNPIPSPDPNNISSSWQGCNKAIIETTGMGTNDAMAPTQTHITHVQIDQDFSTTRTETKHIHGAS